MPLKVTNQESIHLVAFSAMSRVRHLLGFPNCPFKFTISHAVELLVSLNGVHDLNVEGVNKRQTDEKVC